MELSASVPQLAHITGCGRSGTTILGEILATHPDVAFLNDRADLWVRWFPAADIWGRRDDSSTHGASIELTAADCDPTVAADFRRALSVEGDGRRVVVEKLPINNFRLDFLLAVSPQARWINIVRHGIEVAHSIAAKAAANGWYGREDRKWLHLVDYAQRHGYGDLVGRCSSVFLRGLLEWRMSVEAAEAFLALRRPRVLHVRYEDLIANPSVVARSTIAFLGLPAHPPSEENAAERIRRSSPAAADRPIPEGAEEIAGPTLRRFGYWSDGEPTN